MDSWCSSPPAEAWDITSAGSFYCANPTATLMWMFSTWRHDIILGLIMFAILVSALAVTFVVVNAVRWGAAGTLHLLTQVWQLGGSTAGSPASAHLDVEEELNVKERIPACSVLMNPLVITPETPSTPVTNAARLPDLPPPPCLDSPHVPIIDWQETTTGAIVRQSSRISRRLRSNSVPQRP